MELPRRTIAELITRYELEPSLSDIYVEGEFDKDILKSIYSSSNVRNKSIYVIDTVDVDESFYEKHALTSGNKQKVLILCRELSHLNQDGNVRFIADRDNDHWFGQLENTKGLIWTEFCDIETYFFEEAFVKELVIDAGRSSITNWENFYESFSSILKTLYALRAAARDAKIILSYIEFAKFLVVDNDVIKLDFDTYLFRVLLKSNQASEKDNIVIKHTAWLERLQGDPRLYCRGHDFIVLMAWSILKTQGVKSLNDEAISRTLLLLVPRDPTRFTSLI